MNALCSLLCLVRTTCQHQSCSSHGGTYRFLSCLLSCIVILEAGESETENIVSHIVVAPYPKVQCLSSAMGFKLESLF